MIHDENGLLEPLALLRFGRKEAQFAWRQMRDAAEDAAFMAHWRESAMPIEEVVARHAAKRDRYDAAIAALEALNAA